MLPTAPILQALDAVSALRAEVSNDSVERSTGKELANALFDSPVGAESAAGFRRALRPALRSTQSDLSVHDTDPCVQDADLGVHCHPISAFMSSDLGVHDSPVKGH